MFFVRQLLPSLARGDIIKLNLKKTNFCYKSLFQLTVSLTFRPDKLPVLHRNSADRSGHLSWKEDDLPVQCQGRKEDDLPVQCQDRKEDNLPVQCQGRKKDDLPVQCQGRKEDDLPVQCQGRKKDDLPVQYQSM